MILSTCIESIANELTRARVDGTVWKADFAQPLTIDDAYAVQDRVAELLSWFPEDRPVTWKVGSPDRAAEPTAASLPAARPSGTRWAASGHSSLGVEVELAFRLGETPGTHRNIVDCIDTVCVSIELVCTRLEDGMAAPMPWKLADHQLHGGLVIGAERAFSPRDWARQRCSLTINGNQQIAATGAHPCGDPLFALPWLAKHALRRCGGMRAGDLITTGSWTGIVPVHAGDLVVARFDDVGEASVAITA